MEFFGFTLFGGLTGGALLATAAVIFVVGLVLTIKGGDWFVDSASWFAEATGIPKFVVGATIVSFATTLPEMLVSVRAAMNGSAQLAIGNAVGSVTANTTLIMGVSLVAMAGVIGRKEFSLKGGLLLAAIVGLTVLSLSGALPVWSAYILWAIFLVFMISNLIEGKKGAAEETVDAYEKKVLPSKILFFVLGTACIVFGAEFLVSSGKTLAAGFGVSEAIIGFTVIALGTSLPELVTTLTAIRKKENSLSVGNIIGANIIDATLILPLCAVINGQALPVEKINLVFDFPVCIAACAIAIVPTIIQGRFKKWQGFALLAVYALYMLFLVLNETGVIALA
ncbi:MAG: calcium/sodium antiporter [Ruminococcaceae bacterium]|nr:calcium/sodium antiporter [Oscillospiraceae bacterium]